VIATLVGHQLRSLRRQRVFAVLLGAFLLMTALAGLLGYSSSRTIVRVYEEAANLLATTGKPAPPNPFTLKPTLSLLSNMVIYIPFIGALLAVVLGHLSIVNDESGGVGRLLFSRQVDRSSYVVAKVLAAATALAVILLASLLLSIGSVFVVNGSTSPGDVGRLGTYYALSWLYLLLFALIGMLTVLITRRRSMALLSGMGVWLVLTFVLPQFTSGLHPVASLNPITTAAGTSQGFFRVTSQLRPVSIAENYKEASGSILHTATVGSAGHTLSLVLPLVVMLLLCLLLAFRLVQSHDFSRSATHE